MLVLMSTSSSSVEIAFIFVQTLLDQGMKVTKLIRCPRARLRLQYDDKPCASSDGWSERCMFSLSTLRSSAPRVRRMVVEIA